MTEKKKMDEKSLALKNKNPHIKTSVHIETFFYYKNF